MKIVAFLQNQWFYNADRVRAHYARRQGEPLEQWWARRARWNGRYLFGGCLTGRRLLEAFGEKVCDRIIWENVSPRIANKASECFGVDWAHVAEVNLHFKPDIVLLFGKVAQSAQIQAPQIIRGPHPAARHAGVVDELREMAHELQLCIDKGIAA